MKDFVKTYIPVISGVLTVVALIAVWRQLYQGNEHRKWETYNAMNLRYSEWYAKMPRDMDVDSCLPFDKQDAEVKRWVRAYFSLYSEEYWLYLNGLLPEDLWTKRIDNGVDINLKAYPMLVRGYEYWKGQGSFLHPEEFRKLVDAKLEKLKPELKLLACKPA